MALEKRSNNGQIHPLFIETHKRFLERTEEGDVGLVLLGDSIMEDWGKYPEIYQATFGEYHPVNYGLGGDRTQNVLWRIENGELDGLHPQAVILMVGTNNLTIDSPEGIARGIEKIVSIVRKKLPESKLLLLGILPRGKNPEAFREKICQTNGLLEKLEDKKSVYYLDIGKNFLNADGTINAELMPDFLHPSGPGYEQWGKALKPVLGKILGECQELSDR